MNTSTPSTKRPQKISTDALFSRIQVEDSFKAKAYAALKEAILKMDLYGNPEPIMLDERELSVGEPEDAVNRLRDDRARQATESSDAVRREARRPCRSFSQR